MGTVYKGTLSSHVCRFEGQFDCDTALVCLHCLMALSALQAGRTVGCGNKYGSLMCVTALNK